MHYANNYQGKIPFELYIKLQNQFPQADGESEAAWLIRVKKDPMLAQRMFGTPEFKTELIQAVARRTMAQAGAKRVGHANHGPSLMTLTKPGAKNAKQEFAKAYVDEFMVKNGNQQQYKYAKEAYDMLIEQFDALTPPSGSIFWNGVNELALAKLVDKWNKDLGKETFGQLEATTAARYVNKKFEWEEGGIFQKYFTEVSDKLGQAASGHVTSVVRCGLRFDSIFTTTELPRMLKIMDEELKARKTPTVTDLTIVVIEPKGLDSRPVTSFTNTDITMIPIVRPLPGRRINGRDDCTIDGHVGLNPRVREYWSMKPKPGPSAAAERIMADSKTLVRW